MLIVISNVVLILASLVLVISALGILRFGTIFLRMHAASKGGGLGCALFCLAFFLQQPSWWTLFLSFVILIGLAFTIPVASHLLIRSYMYKNGGLEKSK